MIVRRQDHYSVSHIANDQLPCLGIDFHSLDDRVCIDVIVVVTAAERSEIHSQGTSTVKAFVKGKAGLDVRVDPSGRYEVWRLVAVVKTNVGDKIALLHKV